MHPKSAYSAPHVALAALSLFAHESWAAPKTRRWIIRRSFSEGRSSKNSKPRAKARGFFISTLSQRLSSSRGRVPFPDIVAAVFTALKNLC